ncbi:uncharacterized protein LOC119110217 [Pollicipes pollicipes]|uniref:uncharacterized protein LOC119110217 n=1 Tax=Pollicipes pollicipes TaxID=41117 RepID=UPI0018855ED7|nr:uncharacterized protein LOC119110217 [Pollicipes pollicipes]
MALLRLPLLLLLLPALLAGAPAGGMQAGTESTDDMGAFSIWEPHRVAAPREFAAQQKGTPAERVGRLAALLRGIGGSEESHPSCQPGTRWTTECGVCMCSPTGEARCAGEDCTFIPEQGSDGSILELGMGDDMDLQALSSERHVLVLLP